MANIPLITFNKGELSPKIDNRVDTDAYGSGCRRLENMIPEKYGCATRRPGLKYIYDSTLAPGGAANDTVIVIPFIYSVSVAYMVEFGNYYARFYYGDSILEDRDSNEVWISTPYAAEHLYQLKFKQIADTMWIVHPLYAPRKLTRTGVYTFELNVIDFRDGPFLTRNDLIDPDNPSTTTLACDVTEPGSCGILTSNSSIFLPGHEGALFKLVHSRATKHVYHTNAGTSDEIRGKGKYNLITRGTWTGTITWQRNENNTGWETLKEWKGNSGANQNVNSSYEEESETAKHRIYSDDAAGFYGDLSIDEPYESGIVKVLAVLNSFTASVEVYSQLASTSATRRWHEGAWSESRGYPGSFCFFEGRSVYAGASRSLADEEFSASDYPELVL